MRTRFLRKRVKFLLEKVPDATVKDVFSLTSNEKSLILYHLNKRNPLEFEEKRIKIERTTKRLKLN